MRPSLLIVALLALGACAVSPTMPLPATVEISDELPEDEVEATLAAVDAWNKEVPGIIVATKMRSSASKKERTIFVRRGKPVKETADAHAKTSFCRSTVVIGETVEAGGGAYAYKVVLHEFGHAFGLDHNTDPDSVMNHGMTITDEDAADARGALRHRRKHHKECVNKSWLALND